MNIRLIIGLLILVLAFPLRGQNNMAERFSPPDSTCRPWVRWWWNGDKVERNELIRELHLLHDAGIGGVEINPIEFPSKRCDDLGKHSLMWLSDEWLDMLEAVLKEAKTLGMGCDLLVGSGWPWGREATPHDERAQVMLTYVTDVYWTGDKPFVITKQQIFDAVDPKVTELNADRQFELVDIFIVPDSVSDIHQRNDLNLPAGDTISIPSIVQIANNWHSSPNGKYLFYALVRCTSFASVINGAPGASGPIIDHMNAIAVRHFLDYMQKRLEGRLGPMRNWLRAYFVDSMELEGSNWTSDFAEEFQRRNGYDIIPWLPFTMFKTGRLGEVTSYEYGAKQSPDFRQKVQKVRRDFERTKAELLYERFSTVFAEWCAAQGVQSRGQAYGRGFFPLLSSTAYTIPEGESWTTNYLRHRLGEEMPDGDYRRGRGYTMINKYVSSAAHHSGRRIASCEEMTNTYRIFETTLELLKLGSDMSAFSGVTHSVWHGFNYSPPEAGFPGWVQYGSYLNEKNSWWSYFHLLNEYRSRMSSVLQGLRMETPITILAPTEQMWGEYGVQTEPFPYYPKGSGYDITPLLWEAIHKNGSGADIVRAEWLSPAYADGVNRNYKAVFLPRTTYLDSNSLQQLRDFARHGGIIFCIGTRPVEDKSFILLPEPDSNHYLEWYANVQRQYRLPNCVEIDSPDRFLLHNAYRDSLGNPVYLFCNAHLDTAVSTMLHFPKEVWKGRTAWLYNAATDEQHPLPLDRGSCRLNLPPVESIFIIFEPKDTTFNSQLSTFNSYNESQRHLSIPMRWHLSLHHAIEGWSRYTVLDQLCDLRKTQYKDFSGTITYTARFHLDSIISDNINSVKYTPEEINCIDLGRVYDICELKVNGTDCGVKWYGERRYDNLGGLLHPGENTIKIKVTTTLNNYVHTLKDNGVVQHFVLKRNIATTPAGLVGPVMFY